MDILNLARRYEDWKTRARSHSYMEVRDNGKIAVDFVRAVLLYERDIIKLRCAKNIAVIVGTGLTMSTFTTESVVIRGKIGSISFESDKP
ncbi:hypothetical protein FACS1894120_5110 [Clostridia bacterium]|nr:hypothetical protein FACS1894120_5110 [Clostridia bacterium]